MPFFVVLDSNDRILAAFPSAAEAEAWLKLIKAVTNDDLYVSDGYVSIKLS